MERRKHDTHHTGGIDLESLELAHHIVDALADGKGEDILLLDISKLSIIADYFIIGSALSERQARALIRDITQETKEALDTRPLNVEGETTSGWVLMDYGGVVVHIFTPEARDYYNLEELWQDAQVVARLL